MKTKNLLLLSLSSFALSGCVSDGMSGSQMGNILNSDLTRGVLSSVLSGQSGSLGNLTNTDIIAGLKQALSIGTDTVVSQLGQTNGFNLDPKIRIPLPSTLQKVDDALSLVGMSQLTEDLELRLNRAAEAATPRAKELFINAISQMSFTDAKEILTGPNDAATQFLRRTMGGQLSQDMAPIVQSTLSQAGAVQAYDQVMSRYGRIPFMPDVKADLNSFVVDKALDGIFSYVAQEEAAIRANPAKRTTELLQKVFGAVN